ncbi:MAG: phosphotransferase [Anaerohalosphaeraceae bacterium]|nr:phosphotransferase [Anaerohalosphaeraceae bacterium]
MPKGGAHFISQELALVLSHYDIGIIQSIKSLTAGNRKAPKQIVVSDTGKYLLKRRAGDKNDRYRVTFSHAVQQHLQKKKFPLPNLITTRDEGNSFLELDKHIYELFEFTPGVRFDSKDKAVQDAGKTLAKFHTCLEDFSSQSLPLKTTFHDASPVRRYLKKISTENNSNGSDKDFQKIVEKLMTIYNHSSVNVNQLGFDVWPQQIVHGDWHPGNMLFMNGKVTAVLDFDSLKVSPPLIDLANGMLQYSIVAGRPNPIDWPDYLDQAKLAHFIYGYLQFRKIKKEKTQALADLMIETLIAEAVLPIAATGSFIHLSGSDFLKMILRKCLWIQNNHEKLTDAIEHISQDLDK